MISGLQVCGELSALEASITSEVLGICDVMCGKAAMTDGNYMMETSAENFRRCVLMAVSGQGMPSRRQITYTGGLLQQLWVACAQS